LHLFSQLSQASLPQAEQIVPQPSISFASSQTLTEAQLVGISPISIKSEQHSLVFPVVSSKEISPAFAHSSFCGTTDSFVGRYKD